MQVEAVLAGVQAICNCPEIDEENPANSYKQIACDIVKEFEKKFKPFWHCIVGKDKFILF